MKAAKDLIPWTVTDISIRPYEHYWSMNPSIHFDGSTWRCVLRCVDYAMPDGRTIRSKKASPGAQQTKNAMVVFDPRSWKPISIHKMHERDDHPRVACGNVGYEDMRLFRTDRGGLQGIAASLHLERDGRPKDGGTRNQPPEQVLVSFDAEYNIVKVRPIRGDWWSGMPQKNWVPFDHAKEQRFLYSIGKGVLFDDRGAIKGDEAMVTPSAVGPAIMSLQLPDQAAIQARVQREQLERERLERERLEREEREREQRERDERERRERKDRDRDKHDKHDRHADPRRPVVVRGTDAQLMRGRRVMADASTTRPSTVAPRHGTARTTSDSRVVGRAQMPKYDGLRGGTQLVRISADRWLGIGHEMKWLDNKKYYWHTWYVVDGRGKMTSVSEPMKLASNGIEFAAGLAIEGDRVVVSFGVDDMECKVGETRLSAVAQLLRPVE